MNTEHVERAEAELDRFVEKRAREARDAAKLAKLWAESTRRDREKRRRENRAAWYEYEMHMANLHASLSEEHRMKAERLNEPEAESA